MSLKRKVFASLKWSAAGTVLQAVLRIVTLAILARLLSPTELGLWAGILVISTLVELVLTFGAGPALIYKQELSREYISSAFLVSTITAAITTSVIYFSAPLLSWVFAMPEITQPLKAYSPLFLMRGVISVYTGLLQRNLQFGRTVCVDLCTYTIGNIVVACFLAQQGLGVYALIFGACVEAALALICYAVLAPANLAFRSLGTHWKEIIEYSSGIAAARILNHLGKQADRFMVGRFFGAEALGIYSRALQIISSLEGLFNSGISRVAFSGAAKVNSLDARRQAFLSSSSILILLAGSASGFISACSTEITAIVLGPGWEAVALPLGILSLGLFFRLKYGLCIVFARAWVDTKSVVKNVGAYSLFTVLACGFAAYFGTTIMAIAVTSSMVFQWWSMTRLFLSRLDATWSGFFFFTRNSLFVALAVAFVAHIAATFLRQQNAPPVIIVLVAAGLSGALTAILFRAWFMVGHSRFWTGESDVAATDEATPPVGAGLTPGKNSSPP